MKQGSYFLILGLLAICNIAFAQSEKELEALKKQLAAQQEQLDKLTKDMSEKSESRLALSSHIEKLKIKGGLRLRYEYRTRDEFVDTPAPGRWVS